jgi:hypothetical protein
MQDFEAISFTYHYKNWHHRGLLEQILSYKTYFDYLVTPPLAREYLPRDDPSPGDWWDQFHQRHPNVGLSPPAYYSCQDA